MTYFKAIEVPYFILIGKDKSQIFNTVEYYRNRKVGKIKMPYLAESDISEITELCINCHFPSFIKGQFINAKVDGFVSLRVNANVFYEIKGMLDEYKITPSLLKRGDLYKFFTGDIFYFLPEEIMQSMCDYNWKQHEPLVERWLAERTRVCDEFEKENKIIRLNKRKIVN